VCRASTAFLGRLALFGCETSEILKTLEAKTCLLTRVV